MNVMLEQVRRHLARNPDQIAENPHRLRQGSAQAPRSAAVLIPMLVIEADWHLLFIRRAENGDDYHSGQVAFPGGCFEPSDADLEATALREAHEEIGLAPDCVKIIGCLPSLVSTTNYRITPFVGLMPWPYPLRLAPEEVARAFTIPLDWLANPDNRDVYEHTVSSGTVSVIRFRPYAGELLWGATARMTVSFIETLNFTVS